MKNVFDHEKSHPLMNIHTFLDETAISKKRDEYSAEIRQKNR